MVGLVHGFFLGYEIWGEGIYPRLVRSGPAFRIESRGLRSPGG